MDADPVHVSIAGPYDIQARHGKASFPPFQDLKGKHPDLSCVTQSGENLYAAFKKIDYQVSGVLKVHSLHRTEKSPSCRGDDSAFKSLQILRRNSMDDDTDMGTVRGH